MTQVGLYAIGTSTTLESNKSLPFLRPLKNESFKEQMVTTMRLDDLGTSTTLESNKSLREMLLTKHSVVPGRLPRTHRVPGIPRGTTSPDRPFDHSIGQFSRRTHGYHYRCCTSMAVSGDRSVTRGCSTEGWHHFAG